MFASAAWDAIKRGFGCSLVTGLATALWEKLRHGSLDWYAIGGMFVLTLAVVLSIFWKREKRGAIAGEIEGNTKPEPKLKIHRATWGDGPQAEVSVTDQLQNCPREALVIRVDHDLGGLTHDPAFAVRKRIEIDYSYGSDTLIHVSRLEPPAGQTMRLVLPEDTEVARLQERLSSVREETSREWDSKFKECEEEKGKVARELAALVKSIADAAISKSEMDGSISKRTRQLADDLYVFLKEIGPEPIPLIPKGLSIEEQVGIISKTWDPWHDRMFWGYEHKFKQRVADFIVELRANRINPNIRELPPMTQARDHLAVIREQAERLLVLSKELE